MGFQKSMGIVDQKDGVDGVIECHVLHTRLYAGLLGKVIDSQVVAQPRISMIMISSGKAPM